MNRPAPEPAALSLSLSDCLERAITAMWPRRAHQELLLDLGERKQWDLANRREAIDDAAAWLVRELRLPPSVSVGSERSRTDDDDEHVRALARTLGRAAGLGEPTVGVAAWACGIAPALGSSAKAFANSLAGPLRADRSDHRWLRAIASRAPVGSRRDALCFHRRNPQSVADALASFGDSTPTFDAGDALIVLSLLALWQRRRPTAKARGNRGQRQPRRATPKPVAALLGGLAQPAQAVALVNLARHLEPAAGRVVSEVAIESALTEAHLAPHPTRSVPDGHGSATSGESWLTAAESALKEAGCVITEEDRAVFVFRIDRQRAWRARRPQSVSDERLRRNPYVAACLALEQTLINAENEIVPFAPTTPGLLMLLPALRTRGLVEEP